MAIYRSMGIASVSVFMYTPYSWWGVDFSLRTIGKASPALSGMIWVMRYIYRYGFSHFRWGPRLESSLGGMQSMIAVTTTGSLKVKPRVSHRWRRPTQARSPSGASPATVSSRVYHLPYHPPRGYHPVVQRSGRPTALYSNNPSCSGLGSAKVVRGAFWYIWPG